MKILLSCYKLFCNKNSGEKKCKMIHVETKMSTQNELKL